jgi:hypothetical protein
MKVNFQRDFHYGDGRFRERNNPNEVPDSMVDSLPLGAEIVEGPANPKRARKKDGEFKGDDKSTPDKNEAWEGGKAPKKKPAANESELKKKA